jgi:hypothetical protein
MLAPTAFGGIGSKFGQLLSQPSSLQPSAFVNQSFSSSAGTVSEIDTSYVDLPAFAKAEIDRTYTEFKVPMDSVLHDISRQLEPHHLSEVRNAQQKLRLQARNLKTKQERCISQG